MTSVVLWNPSGARGEGGFDLKRLLRYVSLPFESSLKNEHCLLLAENCGAHAFYL